MSAQQTDLIWRTIAEFTLPPVADHVHNAATQVAAAVRDLNLAPARLEQLTGSVSEAMHNALTTNHRLRLELPLQIRVFVAELVDPQTVRCWGFFLIARTADQLYPAGGPAHHMIELFLYQESVPPRESAA